MVLSISFVLIILNNYVIIVQIEAGIYKTIITANYIQVYCLFNNIPICSTNYIATKASKHASAINIIKILNSWCAKTAIQLQ